MAEAPMDGATPGETSNPPENAETSATPTGSPADFLEIKTEPMRATLTIKGGIIMSGHTLTRDAVATRLAALGVVNGVDWAVVDRMIEGKQYDRAQIIATGSPSKPSRDASIQEKLKIDADIHPVMDSTGKADYKNVDNIHQVKKGDVLAVKTPAMPGEAGSDIFGKPQPVQNGKDVTFKLGANTEVSADGLELLASTGGFVFHQAGAICVGVTYVLKGDVDFNTGNLHYQGDIQVLGSVTTGFMVEAQGNIIVESNVDAADVISHGGDVTIKSGAFGHGKGRIVAKKDIYLTSGQDLHIECENGTLFVEKGLRNCTVLAQAVKADKPGCSVVGGEIKVYGEASIGILGGEGCHTTIHVTDKEAEAAKQKLKTIEKLHAELLPKLEPIEIRLKGMKAMAAKFGGTMSDRSKADLKGVLDMYTALKTREKELDTLKENVLRIIGLVPKHVGKFAVTESIIWGGILDMYGHAKELLPEDAQKEWVLTPEGFYGRTIMPEAPAKQEEPPASAAPPA